MDVKQLKKEILRFNEHELERIADHVMIIIRDRKIRREFKRLKRIYGAKEAIIMLADKYFLSEAQVDYIVYPRKR
ncbi:hypothetical protein Calab_1472 [Caldithrix abyssi DSM 13497]|uniref:Uncharacterized protein n=1 Tax=Caldithrix abyssi DSM 13497 TaxID=880073 RepID=H1XPW7_CALAY|nr:hypothetical protein [Caldithrix abyssi]APF20378.1 hypothetical protein Cabys_3632 [Caldithrix abyssi DSM 13497]EHO41093.1 hypothetical protein Calab_1472 [Caldithrix abyssi DSM 13497]